MRRLTIASLVCFLALPALAQNGKTGGTRLLRQPTVSRTSVAFIYAGDLWIAARAGGQARRLTSTPDVESDPIFSPDGAEIAFSRTTGTNTDVYVVPSAGGDPRRLTYHPGADRPRSWSPDGRRVFFASNRTSAPLAGYFQLFSIPAAGGFEEQLPLPRAFDGVPSPDGTRIAYDEISTAFIAAWYEVSEWRHYRGGRTHPIRILNLADHSVEKLPWQNSNDSDPMWVGNTVYFVSDRNFTKNLFAYRTDTRQVRQLTQHDDGDVTNAQATSDAIVYEQNASLHLFDIASGKSTTLNIDVAGDLPWSRPQFKKVAAFIREAELSPTGARAVFSARGDIFTVPAEKGEWRNLTQSPGAHDRDQAWSPDGSQIAWLSDASGEYQLMIGDQLGQSKPRAFAMPAVSFYADPVWSPNGRELLLRDSRLNLWVVDVASGRFTKIDTDVFETPGRLSFEAVWSPDSRWVAYSRRLASHMSAVFLHSRADGRNVQLSDGLADATSPAFDAGGKYLYFLASTNSGPANSWLEMSAFDRPVRKAIYLTVLSSTEPSPFLPELGDEIVAAAPDSSKPIVGQVAAQGAPSAAVGPARNGSRIDTAGIRQRILNISVPVGDYSELHAGPAGSVFYLETIGAGAPGATTNLKRFQVKERAAATFIEGVRTYAISADRKKLLYGAGQRWGIVGTDRPGKVGDGNVDVSQLEMLVDPRVEWAEIFKEAWRTQRDFFYDAAMHGANWQQVYDKYSALLPFVGHRSDLGYLIAKTGGELVVGHSYLLGGGDLPEGAAANVGLLGADFSVENGKYRFKKIYSGESWNPDLRAPLRAPGIQVAEGDYLLEVNGHPVAPPANVFQWFEGTANRQTTIRVGSSATGEGARTITVIPIASEDALRTRAWVENNRRKVDELSNGRLAYVWLPNTGGPGYTSFTRYFYAQQEKEGAIIDERFNQGGTVADYIVNELDRKAMGYFALRSGQPWTSPGAGIFGPKVMLINESAGSGGDALPYMFRQRNLGPLVGTRTWGALVGTTGSPATIDGGGITAPSLAFYDLKGAWRVENEGIAPDIEVENLPAEMNRGHDAQLERGVAEALKLLQQNAVKRVPRPAPIDRVSKP
ncbi:MAG TPA: PDZ domain-containing protein [Gemmatimonadaceae bacterium]|nr:PDZ domain-containing protein [Gemmatimonadaceae bacterium]